MEPIIALATSPIKSAIHVIRLSGDNVFDIISDIFNKNIKNENNKNIHIGYIKDKDIIIDQVVLLTYPHPNSYTGEDVVEIMTHGNVLIDNQIMDLCIAKGCRIATNGEFTSRAYLNHKIDLVQAEAVNDLINATTNESKQIITYALKGETSSLLKPIKIKLLDLISNLEVNIDYPEYQDVEVVNRARINNELKEHQKIIKQLINDGNKGLIIKSGIKVAIIGKPNVGKSTLLNALLKEDKAIVSDIPGTTRDVVEGEVSVDGLTLHLLDTAGIRNSKNKIEAIGINKTKQMIKEADIVIYVKEKEKETLPFKINNKHIIEVINKSDLIKEKRKEYVYISALKHKINPLINKIKEMVGISNVCVRPCFANARELGILRRIDALIDEIITDNNKNAPIDVLTISITSLLNDVLEIFGEKASLDITKEIFSRFCVGK